MNPYAFRRYIIAGIIALTTLIYVVRLFYLQIIDISLKTSADNNSQRFETQFPSRGLIYDRKGKLMVYNEAAYDLMVTMNLVRNLDTAALCEVLNVTPQFIKSTFASVKKSKNYSKYKPAVFMKMLSAKDYALFQEKMYKFPGFHGQTRTLRKYAKPVAAHLLGYVGEIGERDLKRNPTYKLGDYIGISGIEKAYENDLKGKKGVNIYLVDVHNRIMGSYQNGRYDTTAIVGADLVSSIDLDLQEYGEYLMRNMSGSAVAIEPATGEILAMISTPAFDPSLLVGRVRTRNFAKLYNDSLKPLFNRSVMALYPPGSTFKILNGLIGLKEGVLTPNTFYSCAGGYYYGGSKPLACTHVHGTINLKHAVSESCNTYFCNVFRNIIDNRKYNSTFDSYNAWRNYVMSIGFGKKLDCDVPHELNGNVPSSAYYDRFFGKGRWKSATIISLSIGQAELGITPLQMANMAAVIANRGYYYTPHLVKSIKGKEGIDPKFTVKHETPFDTVIYNHIIEGMYGAVNEPGGTAAWTTVQIPNVVICGKTGTSQNPHGKDHSVFVAFAPRYKPKIAIAVYVENAGYGSTWAAPVASLMIEKYLTDSVKRKWVEDRLGTFIREIKQ
jgi:penicillin-binding protein 2